MKKIVMEKFIVKNNNKEQSTNKKKKNKNKKCLNKTLKMTLIIVLGN